MNGVTPRLALRGITKAYPGTLANDRVDLTVMPGEIHALLGENGAGKSTLVRIIYGVTRPDAGSIAIDGRPVAIASPAAARRLGIGMVFQHFSLFETLTVAQNVALGLGVGERGLDRRILDVSGRYGLRLDPRRRVFDLSVGERQRVEIVRCLLQNPRLLIMDEPTSVLTPQEVAGLHETLRRLAAEGCSVLYISHKLHEVQALCEAATVLRNGRVTGRADPRTETARSLAEMMIGQPLPAVGRMPAAAGAPVLEVAGLDLPSPDPHGCALRGIDLTVRAGEIVGIAGVAGNGQAELLMVLAGERQAARADAVRIAGIPAGRLGVRARRRLGLAFVPEERLGRGAVGEMDLAENLLLTHRGGGHVAGGVVRWRRVRRAAQAVRTAFRVVSAGVTAPARSLSGGNLQKFILGREIGTAPRLLVAAHPTWGVDVAAAAMIQQALVDLRDRGAAILVVSEDLDELFEISDRIAVLTDGRLSPVIPTGEAELARIGAWMTGRLETPDGDARDAAA